MRLDSIRWESAVKPLALIGGGIALLAVLPSLLDGGAPPPPPDDVGFTPVAAEPPVSAPAMAPEQAVRRGQASPATRGKTAPGSGGGAKQAGIERRQAQRRAARVARRKRASGGSGDRPRRRARSGRSPSPAPAPAPVSAPAPVATYPTNPGAPGGGSASGSGEFHFEQ